jgi:hypothetical protein
MGFALSLQEISKLPYAKYAFRAAFFLQALANFLKICYTYFHDIKAMIRYYDRLF